MSPLCIGSLPDFFVDCLLLFYLWVMSTCVLICLVLLMDGFPSLNFIYRAFLRTLQSKYCDQEMGKEVSISASSSSTVSV
jgi:hypothetical protein